MNTDTVFEFTIRNSVINLMAAFYESRDGLCHNTNLGFMHADNICVFSEMLILLQKIVSCIYLSSHFN